MIQLTATHKAAIVAGLLAKRLNFDGTDKDFAKQYDINNAVFSQLKTATNFDGLLKANQWMNIGRELDITLDARKWVMAKTEVFNDIAEDVAHCQAYGKSLMCVADCGIGKSFSAKYLSRTLKNAFYVDASQAKTKQSFVRLLAKTIGVDDKDKYVKVKANIKYMLKSLPNPVVMIDEAGDLEYTAFLEVKEFWNATDKSCGWYLIGADGLREKISKGIGNKKVGFAEIFSRFGDRYTTIVPTDINDKKTFYKKLITAVLNVNMEDKTHLNEIVNKCLTSVSGQISGLRRAEDLLILYNKSEDLTDDNKN